METDSDCERLAIRKELAEMSFEDLQKLKQKIGEKCYNETVFNTTSKKKLPAEFKRANKNRPREMSSKIKVSTFREVVLVNKDRSRDPRFDSLCGTYNERQFKHSYSFLTDIKKKEKEQLHRELKDTTDAQRRKDIKYLIQRLENQEREERRKAELEEKKKEERRKQINDLRQGRKPKFIKKSEKKVLDLVDRYEELKKSGKLLKHIEKQRKKNIKRDRKKFDVIKNAM